MIVFWWIAGAMILLSLAIMLPPLLKQSKSVAVARDLVNTAIYKDQLAELDADLNNGNVSQEQYEQGRRDLERNLLADAELGSKTATPARSFSSGRLAAIVVGLAVPALAISLYMWQTQQTLTVQPSAQIADAPMGGFTPERMVEQLAARLKSNPQDGEGWLKLGRSYTVLGRFPEASEAYAKALPLMKEDAQLLADYAEALALSKPDQDLAGQPTALAQQALKLDPNNQKALWIAGMAAFQKGQFKVAINYWEVLSQSLPEKSEDADVVKKRIAEATARLGKSP